MVLMVYIDIAITRLSLIEILTKEMGRFSFIGTLVNALVIAIRDGICYVLSFVFQLKGNCSRNYGAK